MKNVIIVSILLILIYGCSNSNENLVDPTTPDIVKDAVYKGGVEFTFNGITQTKDTLPYVDPVDRSYFAGGNTIFEKGNTKMEITFTRNLSGMPYNIKLKIWPNESNTSTFIDYKADFERPMFLGENYRLPVTTIIAPGVAFVPGNTGGQVSFEGELYGIGFDSELTVKISATNNPFTHPDLVEPYLQYARIKGTFVYDGNKYSEATVGTFDIEFYGDQIVDINEF